ncbi:MAG: NADPH:quinone oxidoreductase family protein [Alphaproteobacteria bacterium]
MSEVPSPVPGPGQVRIAVHAAGCNFADTLMISGHYQYKPEMPFTPGLEVAGTIMDAGPDVTGFRPGDRVMSWVGLGGYAEEALANANNTALIPDGMDFTVAAGFPITYSTATITLEHRQVHLAAGEVLLVHGATGGAGLAAVDVGKAMGATVVATVGSDAKMRIARESGADHVINYTTESIRDQVKALVGGADVVFDPVGGDAFAQSLRCINEDGRLAIIGFASGTVPQIPANYLLVKNISAIGISVGGYRRSRPDLTRQTLSRLSEWFAAGKLRPLVGQTFPLERTAEALNMLLTRRATGKVVVITR